MRGPKTPFGFAAGGQALQSNDGLIQTFSFCLQFGDHFGDIHSGPQTFIVADLSTKVLEEIQKSPGDQAGAFFAKLIGRRPTLPHTRACSTIGAERLNFRVRDGNGWNPLAVITRNWFGFGGLNSYWRSTTSCIAFFETQNKFYGQAERAISNSQLNTLLCLHICPINVIVFHGSSGRSHLREGFVLICIQHLS